MTHAPRTWDRILKVLREGGSIWLSRGRKMAYLNTTNTEEASQLVRIRTLQEMEAAGLLVSETAPNHRDVYWNLKKG